MDDASAASAAAPKNALIVFCPIMFPAPLVFLCAQLVAAASSNTVTGGDDLFQESLCPFLLRMSEYFVWLAILDDTAAIEEQDAISKIMGKAHLMGHEQHRHVRLAAKLPKDIQHFLHELRIQC
jgi:hypothetical protein